MFRRIYALSVITVIRCSVVGHGEGPARLVVGEVQDVLKITLGIRLFLTDEK